ncbi:VOC family protein [Myxococcota bacterium]|nr:VOC family protein [Myxococcota bacterium]MBU1430105.1 VOC family protein [Myxococcota bacterium]MBU1896837.1 VOC family protein [Myxococcota bacterium]
MTTTHQGDEAAICFEGVAHIGVKVRDIAALRGTLTRLGFTPGRVTARPEVGLKLSLCGVGGAASLELLEDLHADSALINAPLGLHHIALRAPDIEGAYRALQRDPAIALEGPIRQGAHGRICFFRIKDSDEILFECVEAPRAQGEVR